MTATDESRPDGGRSADLCAAGDLYEPYVERWSRAGRGRVPRAGSACRRAARWLDVGCGTGALSRAILDRCAPAAVLGVDPSEGFLAHARRPGAATRGPIPRSATPGRCRCADACFDAVVERPGAELRAGPAESRRGDAPCRPSRRDSRGLCLGLRRGHADDAPLLGCGRRAGPGGARAGRGAALPALPARAVARAFRAARGCAACEVDGDRGADGVPRLRRLLDTLPRRAGARAGLLHALSEDRRAALRERLRASLPAEPAVASGSPPGPGRRAAPLTKLDPYRADCA